MKKKPNETLRDALKKVLTDYETSYVPLEEINNFLNLSKDIELKIINQVLEAFLDHNEDLYKEELAFQKEIKSLPTISSGQQDNNKKGTAPNKQVVKSTGENPLALIDVESHIALIDELDDYNQLGLILPHKDDIQFEEIINKILINYSREEVELRNLINSSIGELSKEELLLFKKEIGVIVEKKEAILNYKTLEQFIPKSEVVNQKNQLVYIKNNRNEPAIYSQLKGKEDIYSCFYELFKSIEDGTFKSLKRFLRTDRQLFGLAEVRVQQSRVIFIHLYGNIYGVITAIEKKSDKGIKHRLEILSGVELYNNQKEEIMKLIQMPEYLLEEQETTNQLYEMLEESVKKHERIK